MFSMSKITLISLILLLGTSLNANEPPIVQYPSDKEMKCLTDNVYYEARGEPLKGKLAVALVTLNRAADARFPSTICKVVYQKYQFSWTAFKSKITDKGKWQEAQLAAHMAVESPHILGDFKATHFHNTSVKPGWKLKRITRIGQHIFYI